MKASAGLNYLVFRKENLNKSLETEYLKHQSFYPGFLEGGGNARECQWLILPNNRLKTLSHKKIIYLFKMCKNI